MTEPRTNRRRSRRGGFLAPALGMAVLVTLGIAGVALNTMWLRSARREAASAADAAALAAAAGLACDERLLDAALPADALDRAADRSAALAAEHRIAGRTAALLEGGRPRFGKVVTTEGGTPALLETDQAPDRAAVTVGRGPDGVLPWMMRLAGSRGRDLTATATAGIDNRVAALRPRSGGTVPVWPLALRGNAVGLKTASSGAVPAASAAAASWSVRIDAGLGGDEYAWDAATRTVRPGSDGLKELVVYTLARGGKADEVGLVVCDLGQGLGPDSLSRVFQHGPTADDLTDLGGEVPIAGLSAAVAALPEMPPEVDAELTIGQSRALFLFGELIPFGAGQYDARLDRVVVARLMDLQPISDGSVRATFQPAVLATGTAVTGSAEDGPAAENRYVYRLRLTN